MTQSIGGTGSIPAPSLASRVVDDSRTSAFITQPIRGTGSISASSPSDDGMHEGREEEDFDAWFKNFAKCRRAKGTFSVESSRDFCLRILVEGKVDGSKRCPYRMTRQEVCVGKESEGRLLNVFIRNSLLISIVTSYELGQKN